MWIEFREVESACEQEDHGTNRGEPAVAARLALGGLAAWNSPLKASRKPLVWRVCGGCPEFCVNVG